MTKTYVDIIVDITSEKLDRSFQYLVPEHLEGKLQPGMQVQVPFGNGGRTIKGYVIRVTDQPSFDVSRMKEIREVETGSNSIESRLIALAAWIREQCHDDPGIKNRTSGQAEDETERRALDPVTAHKGRSERAVGTMPQKTLCGKTASSGSTA